MNNPSKSERNDASSHPAENPALLPLTREMLDEQAFELSRTALEECTTDETMTLRLGGRVLELRPLDTRRFVKHMSRFISMN